MLKKPPRVRDNNGALQVRLRLDGRDHFINRLGRFDDPVAQARGQAICAEIWRDAQQGDLDLSLNRYRPLVERRDQDLLVLLGHWQRRRGRQGRPMLIGCLRATVNRSGSISLMQKFGFLPQRFAVQGQWLLPSALSRAHWRRVYWWLFQIFPSDVSTGRKNIFP